MDFIQLWRDDRALSEILCSTIPIPVHDLKIKVTDFEFFCVISLQCQLLQSLWLIWIVFGMNGYKILKCFRKEKRVSGELPCPGQVLLLTCNNVSRFSQTVYQQLSWTLYPLRVLFIPQTRRCVYCWRIMCHSRCYLAWTMARIRTSRVAAGVVQPILHVPNIMPGELSFTMSRWSNGRKAIYVYILYLHVWVTNFEQQILC